MGFLSPIQALIAAGISVPVLLLLYFLKLRRPQVVISSTLLWTRAMRDLRANSPFQRLRRNLLLLLQLTALAALLIAAARPVLKGSRPRGGRVILLIDQSASMNATDERPSRLDRAKKIALALIDQLSDGSMDHRSGGAMIIRFAGRPTVVQPFTTDWALLRRGVQSIEPTDLPTRLAGALEIVRPWVLAKDGSGSDGSTQVYLISDGAVQTPVTWDGLPLNHLKVGGPAENLAIVSLTARRDRHQPHRVEVLARLENHGRTTIHTNLTLKLNDQVQHVVPMVVPGSVDGQPTNKPVRLEIDVPSWAFLEIGHDHRDALTADDTAWMTLTPGRPLNVCLVTPGNPFLDRAIRAADQVGNLTSLTPPQYEAGSSGAHHTESFDVIVFDRYEPRAVPTIHSLHVAAVPPVAQLARHTRQGKTSDVQIVLDWRRDHPLMAHVSLDDLVIGQPVRLALPDTAQVLATGQAGPVMAVVRTPSTRHVVVSFDLFKSNWPLQIGFPIFISNCMTWLGATGQTAAGVTLRPGQDGPVPLTVQGDAPHDTGPSVSGAKPTQRSGLPPFNRVGVYHTGAGVQSPWQRLGVSLLDPAESNLATTDLNRSDPRHTGAGVQPLMVSREIWPWFVLAALGLLMVEWLAYTRRMDR